MIVPQSIALMLTNTPKQIGPIAYIFFIISKYKNISLRPCTCNILRLMACNGYRDIEIHINGRYNAASNHFSPISVTISGSETAPKLIMQIEVTNIVTLITFLYAATILSSLSCISDSAG